MTQAFENYNEEFEMCKEDAMKDIGILSNTVDPRARQDITGRIKKTIAEAERYLKLLEAEARAGNATQKRLMQQSVKGCRSKIDKLKDACDRAQLMGDGGQRRQQQQYNEKDGAVRYQQKLDRTGGHLTQAQRTIADTENIGVRIDHNLARQREHLERARDNVEDVRDNTDTAKGLLSTLGRKAITNTIVLWIVILALLGGIGYLIYYKFFNQSSTSK